MGCEQNMLPFLGNNGFRYLDVYVVINIVVHGVSRVRVGPLNLDLQYPRLIPDLPSGYLT